LIDVNVYQADDVTQARALTAALRGWSTCDTNEEALVYGSFTKPHDSADRCPLAMQGADCCLHSISENDDSTLNEITRGRLLLIAQPCTGVTFRRAAIAILDRKPGSTYHSVIELS
jgi:hypothetical protein